MNFFDNDNNEDDFDDNSLVNPVNRIRDFLDYETLDDLKSEQVDHIRACVFVESYLSDPAVVIAVGRDGKFFAYLDQNEMLTDSARGWSEREITEWVTHVEAYQANNGGI
jgi:hypothetical protein